MKRIPSPLRRLVLVTATLGLLVGFPVLAQAQTGGSSVTGTTVVTPIAVRNNLPENGIQVDEFLAIALMLTVSGGLLAARRRDA